jgi:hypothetical protein
VSKYSVPDGHWDDTDEDDDEEDDAPRATVDTQAVDIVYERGPEPNYKYTVRISHGDHDMEPFAVSATRYRRKAQQYWREEQHEDWVDLPEAVRRRVATVVADVDSRSELDPGYRVINPDDDHDGDLRADGGRERAEPSVTTEQSATRRYFSLITEHENDDRVGLIEITDKRPSRREKNAETPFHKIDEDAGDFYIAGKRVSMGYHDFESEEQYEDEDHLTGVVERKLAEIDDEHLEKAGHDPEEVRG